VRTLGKDSYAHLRIEKAPLKTLARSGDSHSRLPVCLEWKAARAIQITEPPRPVISALLKGELDPSCAVA
jgi:hypothetical protein